MTSSPHSSALINAERLLSSVLDKMEKLSVLYTQELDALSIGDMGKFQSLQPDKKRMIKECENGIKDIGDKKDDIKLCDAHLKERLLEMHTILSDLARQSQIICSSRARSVKRIQERLLHAARSMMSKKQQAYGRNGKIESAAKNRPIATAINEAI